MKIKNKVSIKFQFGLAVCLVALLVSQPAMAQVYPDRHTTNGFEGWLSCQPSTHPSSGHGPTHWIEYDFGANYSLHDMHIWNMNHPDYVRSGIKEVIIEVSTNGNSWTLVDTVSLPKATTSGQYEGFVGPDLGGVNARYMLLTALSNHGDGCFGLSEVRVYTSNQAPTEFDLSVLICENDGILKNLTGGMELGGTYQGFGVTDNNDGTFNFDPDIAGPGVHPVDYVYGGNTLSSDIQVLPCNHNYCPECNECSEYEGMSMTINNNPIPTGGYSSGTILSAGKVNSNYDVRFFIRQGAELNQGFEVASTGQFLALKRVCTDAMTANYSFEDDFNGWSFYVNSSQATATNTILTPGFHENKLARIDVTNAGTSSWHVNLYQEDFSLTAGKTYELSFAARADGGGMMNVRVQLDQSPWTGYLSKDINLEDHWQNFSFTFVPQESVTNNVSADARFGEYVGTYYLDRFKLVQID